MTVQNKLVRDHYGFWPLLCYKEKRLQARSINILKRFCEIKTFYAILLKFWSNIRCHLRVTVCGELLNQLIDPSLKKSIAAKGLLGLFYATFQI